MVDGCAAAGHQAVKKCAVALILLGEFQIRIAKISHIFTIRHGIFIIPAHKMKVESCMTLHRVADILQPENRAGRIVGPGFLDKAPTSFGQSIEEIQTVPRRKLREKQAILFRFNCPHTLIYPELDLAVHILKASNGIFEIAAHV